METYSYITAEEVVSLLQKKDAQTIIVDVRDGDYLEGHIKGAKQVPSGKFNNVALIDNLIENLPQAVKLVILHCQLSQIRGPKCARRLSERYADDKWKHHTKPTIKVLKHGYDGFFNQVFEFNPELFENVQ